jgi:predicted hydrolase (HD superfamily)
MQHLYSSNRYEGLEVKSVLKKLKTPSFAAQVSRDDIADALARIEIPQEILIQFIIDHQRDIS